MMEMFDHKEYYKKNGKKYMKEYYQKNKNKIKEYNKKRYIEKRIEILESQKKYINKNKKRIQEYQLEWRKKNKDKKYKSDRNYFLQNKDRLIKYRKDWVKNKKNNEPGFKIKCYLSSRLNSLLNGNVKITKTSILIDCPIKELKCHLEKQFQKGMSWKNYGLRGWHVDHIKPCCSFDLLKLSEQKKCFHYTNLQPLWAYDNLSKGGK